MSEGKASFFITCMSVHGGSSLLIESESTSARHTAKRARALRGAGCRYRTASGSVRIWPRKCAHSSYSLSRRSVCASMLVLVCSARAIRSRTSSSVVRLGRNAAVRSKLYAYGGACPLKCAQIRKLVRVLNVLNAGELSRFEREQGEHLQTGGCNG